MRDATKLASLVVLERLDHFGPGVHHERPVVEHRLPNRPSAQDQHINRGCRLSSDRDPVAAPENGQPTLPNRVPGRTYGALSGQHVDQHIEVAVPRNVKPRAVFDRRVRHRGRSVSYTPSALTVALAG